MSLAGDVFLYIRAFWPDWKTRMSGVASIALLLIGAIWNIPIKRWQVFLAAAICYVIASFRVWQVEHKKASVLSPLLRNLGWRCADNLKKWDELAELYANTQEGHVLPEPIFPAWGSSELRHLPFKIGSQQARFYDLYRDMKKIGVAGDMNLNERMPLSELRILLREWQKKLENL